MRSKAYPSPSSYTDSKAHLDETDQPISTDLIDGQAPVMDFAGHQDIATLALG